MTKGTRSKVILSKAHAGERLHFIVTSTHAPEDNMEVWVWPDGGVSWKTTTEKGACVVVNNAVRKRIMKLLGRKI